MNVIFRWENHIGPVCYIIVKNRVFGLCLCHRRKDRSFPFFGLEKFLCSRCIGCVLGGFSAIIAIVAGFSFPGIWAGILLIPLIIDGLTQAFFLRESNNLIRFITGLLAGWGIVYLGVASMDLFRFFLGGTD